MGLPVFAEALDAEFRRGIHDQFGLVGGDVNRRAGAMVFRVGEEFGWIFLADDGHALGSAGAEKDELKPHAQSFLLPNVSIISQMSRDDSTDVDDTAH